MKRSWSQRGQQCGELGIIESVSLRNFMCHDNLKFDFDPHMNFIVGLNGSGKSAVLTGIILALGGKSGLTGRHSNLKGFIKTGKSSSTVSITLKNCGVMAYKPEEYGQKITVERHFTSDGSGSYKIKSQAGKIISTSKEELNNILSVMDIQIENPVTVLTQDVSKNFLISKNSKCDKLYQLFFKGTGLAKVEEDYTRGLQQEEEMKSELENKKSILPEMEKDIKKLKSLLDKSAKVTELKCELLWANVIEFEKRRDNSKQELEKVEASYLDLDKKLKNYEDQLKVQDGIVADCRMRKTDCKDTMNKMRTDLQELQQKLGTLASEEREIEGTYSSDERQMKKCSIDYEGMEHILREIKTKNETDINAYKLRHEEALASLQKEAESCKSRQNMLELNKQKLHEAEADCKSKYETCHAELQNINYKEDIIKTERAKLVHGLTNRINVYGREMLNILQDVNRAVQSGLFRVEPKGPIGLFINVKDPQWNFAIQQCLSPGFLSSFLCDNHFDADCLTKILKKHCQQKSPSIITSKFVNEVYDVTKYKAVSDHPTVLDMIDVSDPVVTNCLIDQKSIENIILIADSLEANELMLRCPPRNCRRAYTLNGDELCHSPFRNYACKNNSAACMLKTVNEEDIRKKDEELESLKSQKLAKNAEKNQLCEQQRVIMKKISIIDKEIAIVKKEMNSINARRDEEMNTYEEPRDIKDLQNDLKILEEKKVCLNNRLNSTKSALMDKKKEKESLVNEIAELKRNLQVEIRNSHTLSESLTESENKKEKVEITIKKIKDQLQAYESAVEECKQNFRNAEATVVTATKTASESGNRIETRRSSETIAQILKETEMFVNKQRTCNRTAILKDYTEKIESLKNSKSELERLEKLHVRIKQMIKKRLMDFKKTCHNTSVSLALTFIMLLKSNNFDGFADVDFDDQTLEVCVNPEKSSNKDERTPLQQLSGGERSFVTIALLLSLWDRINTPFKILDEFDVFMDSNNRHLSISLLVDHARAKKQNQYIFLSPLELPDIEDSDDIKLHKMPPPRK